MIVIIGNWPTILPPAFLSHSFLENTVYQSKVGISDVTGVPNKRTDAMMCSVMSPPVRSQSCSITPPCRTTCYFAPKNIINVRQRLNWVRHRTLAMIDFYGKSEIVIIALYQGGNNYHRSIPSKRKTPEFNNKARMGVLFKVCVSVYVCPR